MATFPFDASERKASPPAPVYAFLLLLLIFFLLIFLFMFNNLQTSLVIGPVEYASNKIVFFCKFIKEEPFFMIYTLKQFFRWHFTAILDVIKSEKLGCSKYKDYRSYLSVFKLF